MEKKRNDLLWKNISTLPYFRGFLRAVEGRYYDQIDIQKPTLDLGIGDGHFSATTLPGVVDFGVDPEFKSLIEANHYKAADLLICSTGASLPFPENHFSTVISNSVLEHIRDLDSVLAEVMRVLDKNGTFVICVPNNKFTENLSIAVFLKKMRMQSVARWYQNIFNKISRHYHPDEVKVWKKNLESAGFTIKRTWNYFPPSSLTILEWGHAFGVPQWINKKIFGRWILFPKYWNLWPIYEWLRRHYEKNQTTQNGAYSFFILKGS